ncbi:MAG TPA: hypothetical protein VGW38_22000, partial [Chloroflexota bacterium]|nr:hypothetical protein [Chloroflexota bacterium]
PGGAKVVLHATNYGELTGNAKTDLAIRKAVRDALVYHTVLSATNSVGQPDTLVTVKVTVPEISVGGPFATRMIISTKPRGKGDVTAQEGFDSTILSGQQMMVQFLLGKA